MDVSYFENIMNGDTFTHVVDIPDRSELLLPSRIRGACKALNIHPDCFGLDLD